MTDWKNLSHEPSIENNVTDWKTRNRKYQAGSEHCGVFHVSCLPKTPLNHSGNSVMFAVTFKEKLILPSHSIHL